ncbi:unnamed protein product [Trichobilharzia szidati]|nr:unnamed protein product [Trichobilharzia szidati]
MNKNIKNKSNDNIETLNTSNGDAAEDDTDIPCLAHDITNKQEERTADIFEVDDEDDDDNDEDDDGCNTSNKKCKISINNIHFTNLQLSKPVLRGLQDAGFIRPSPIQFKAIPMGTLGLDLIVQAKSGTGKTVVFAVVILDSINVKEKSIQAIVLSPTREIALQSQMVIKKLGCHIPDLKCHLFVGGLPLSDDLQNLSNCHIVVGTPGRVRYLIESGYMSTDGVKHFILDEADLLLSGGADAKLTGGSANNAFPADINYIYWCLPTCRQMLALSATYTDYLVNEYLPRYMNNPVIIRLAVKDPALIGVRQFFHLIQPATRSPNSIFVAKMKFISKLLNAIEFQQCLIFTNFHNSAEDLCSSLSSHGWPVSYISSGLDQGERFSAFKKLRTFQCRVFITTDLTARGIDAQNVNLVISLEVPWDHETYVHRVGRAGRFGSYGASVIIVSDVGDECDLLKRIQAKCPRQIRELPDPIPVNLATRKCSVDIDSLVTVTKKMSNIQPRPLAKELTKQKLKNPIGKKSAEVFKRQEDEVEDDGVKTKGAKTRTTTTRKTIDKTKGKSKSSSPSNDLFIQLSKYANLLKSEYCGGRGSAKNSPIRDNKSPYNDINNNESESNLLSLIGNYHKDDMINNNSCPVNRNKVDKHPNHDDDNDDVDEDHEEEDEEEAETETEEEVIVKRKTNKSKKTSSHSKNNSNPSDVEEYHWTSRQISAWYEYHQLLEYAQYYYTQWYYATLEYNQAVNYLNELKSFKQYTDY